MLRFAISCLLGSLLVACGRVQPVDAQSGGAALMRNLISAGRVELHVQEGAAVEACERAALRIDGIEGLAVRCVGPGSTSDPRAARVVIGTHASVDATTLARAIGVEVRAGTSTARASFRYANEDFEDAGDALVATFADPQRNGLPVTLVFGNDARFVVGAGRALTPGWKPGVRLVRSGETHWLAPLTFDGVLDARGATDRVGQRRRAAWSRLRAVGEVDPDLIVRASPDIADEAVRAYVERAADARARVRGWAAGDAASASTLSLRLWSTVDELADAGARDATARVQRPRISVDAWCGGTFDDGGAAVAQASALVWLGEPAETWMDEAAGVEAAGVWWGTELGAWCARLARAGTLPRVHELLDERACAVRSRHVIVPLRALLWRQLREERGAAWLRGYWNATHALQVDQELEERFVREVARTTQPYRAHVDDEIRRRRAHVESANGAATGVGFARAHDLPLASAAWMRELERWRALGANAATFEVLGADDRGLAPFAGEAPSELGTLDGDLRWMSALTHARERGLATSLQLVWLSSPSAGVAGAWARDGEREWAAYFERHARFVEHVAHVAELARVDVLFVGSDLPSISGRTVYGRRAEPREAQWKSDGWRNVLGAARGAFAGRLGFSAGSVAELLDLVAADDLDVTALELFPDVQLPDARAARPSRADLIASIDASLGPLVAASIRSDKPLWLSRIGVRDTETISEGEALELVAQRIAAVVPPARLGGLFVWRAASGAEQRGLSSERALDAARALFARE